MRVGYLHDNTRHEEMSMIHNKLVQIVMDFNNNVETVRESLFSHIFTLAVYFTTVAVDIE